MFKDTFFYIPPPQIKNWNIPTKSTADYKKISKSVNSKHSSFIFPLFSVSFWETEGLQLARPLVALGQIWANRSTEQPSLWKTSTLPRNVPSTLEGNKRKGAGWLAQKWVWWHLSMGQEKKPILGKQCTLHFPLALLGGNYSCWLYFQQLVGLVSHFQRMRGTSINGKVVKKTRGYKSPWNK